MQGTSLSPPPFSGLLQRPHVVPDFPPALLEIGKLTLVGGWVAVVCARAMPTKLALISRELLYAPHFVTYAEFFLLDVVVNDIDCRLSLPAGITFSVWVPEIFGRMVRVDTLTSASESASEIDFRAWSAPASVCSSLSEIS